MDMQTPLAADTRAGDDVPGTTTIGLIRQVSKHTIGDVALPLHARYTPVQTTSAAMP